MTRKFAGLFAAAIVGLASITGPADAQYQTGRTPPTVGQFNALRGQSLVAHTDLLAGLPVATETKWDSRDLGWIPPIKNQSQCGSCWAFSGHGVVECATCKAGVAKADTFNTAEQYTLSCYENGGCNGDDNTTVLKHAKQYGLPTTADYGAYHARREGCKATSAMKLWQVEDWGFADGDAGYEQVGNTQKIKNAIKNFGAVGCAIAADGAFMNVRAGEVFHGSARQINHDVVLVGWDNSKGAWLLRNSWGPNWCDHGYCWIAFGSNSVGTEPVFAIVTPPPPPPAPPHPLRGLNWEVWVGVGLAVAVFVVLVLLVAKFKVVKR